MVMTVDEALNASLSAVMDGHADAADWARVQAAWANDPALRERWRLWQAASDGLHAPELKPLAQDPEALLAALHRQMPAPVAPRLRGRVGAAAGGGGQLRGSGDRGRQLATGASA